MKTNIIDIAKELNIKTGLSLYEYRDMIDENINPNISEDNTFALKVHKSDLLLFLAVLAYLNPKLGQFIKYYTPFHYDEIVCFLELDKDFAKEIEIETYIEKVIPPPPYSNDHFYRHYLILNEEKLFNKAKTL